MCASDRAWATRRRSSSAKTLPDVCLAPAFVRPRRTSAPDGSKKKNKAHQLNSRNSDRSNGFPTRLRETFFIYFITGRSVSHAHNIYYYYDNDTYFITYCCAGVPPLCADLDRILFMTHYSLSPRTLASYRLRRRTCVDFVAGFSIHRQVNRFHCFLSTSQFFGNGNIVYITVIAFNVHIIKYYLKIKI